MTDQNARIKLSDFGAAKIVEGVVDLEVSHSGRFFETNQGSLYWMAPEILCGESYGRRSDIWALGCTMLEIVTGKHPWWGVKGFDELKSKLLRQELPRIPPDLSEKAKDFI